MIRFVRYCIRFGRAERGATAIEYGLLIGLIAIALIGAVTLVGDSVVSMFGGITSDVSTAELIAGGEGAGGDLGNCGDGSGDGSAECENK